MYKEGGPVSNIILDLSIKNALAAQSETPHGHDVVLPWWFKRSTEGEFSHERQAAYEWLMRWLQENAPENAENVFDESDVTQNIIINPMVIIENEVMQAFHESGFKLMTEKDIPSQEKTDIFERLQGGSNFNKSQEWH